LDVDDDLRVDRRPNADQPFYQPREPSEPGVRDLVMVPNWAEFIIFLRRVCAKVHPQLDAATTAYIIAFVDGQGDGAFFARHLTLLFFFSFKLERGPFLSAIHS
jgi:hypothetical protein